MKQKQYRAFGLETGEIYAEGNEEEVRRKLQKKFPSYRTDTKARLALQVPVYPEPLMISKI
ncbi:hypothetical protein [Enterococcus olivae]